MLGSPRRASRTDTNQERVRTLPDPTRVLLLTNDDGVDAPGLEALRTASEGLGELRVVAPSGPFSGCGHVVTTDRPIVVDRRADGCIAVDGTPADCVRL